MLPGISQLDNTPDILRALLEGVTEEQTKWKPSTDRWSIAEILAHMAHAEGHGFRDRVDKMIAEDNPALEEYDQEAFSASGQYSGRDAEDSFAHFEEQREVNVELLRTLTDQAGERTARHQLFGPITVNQLLNEWACHDIGHIRQVAELVRAMRYYPHIGPFQSIYKLNP